MDLSRSYYKTIFTYTYVIKIVFTVKEIINNSNLVAR